MNIHLRTELTGRRIAFMHTRETLSEQDIRVAEQTRAQEDHPKARAQCCTSG
jgi:hypothetical protein